MPRTTRLNKEHCAFPRVEQKVYCHILMEAPGWAWVRQRRSEDVNWTPVLKGSDDSAMIDSGGAFAVEQPFCPRGACDNCFEKLEFQIRRMEKKHIRIQGLHCKWIQIREAIESTQGLIRSNTNSCRRITHCVQRGVYVLLKPIPHDRADIRYNCSMNRGYAAPQSHATPESGTSHTW